MTVTYIMPRVPPPLPVLRRRAAALDAAMEAVHEGIGDIDDWIDALTVSVPLAEILGGDGDEPAHTVSLDGWEIAHLFYLLAERYRTDVLGRAESRARAPDPREEEDDDGE